MPPVLRRASCSRLPLARSAAHAPLLVRCARAVRALEAFDTDLAALPQDRLAVEQAALREARAEQLGGLSSQLEQVRFATSEKAGEVAALASKAEALEKALADAKRSVF
jgi:capsule polysaccharide export protein KpsE/RkpR